jgi:DNA-cytosine methyltransferase
MKVLSLFDGISGAMLALKFLGIGVDEYYASEIEESAISVSKRNFPEIIQVGDVEKIDGNDPRFTDVDLLIAGSPCTNLSIAGDGTGLDGNQSKLFYEFIRLLKDIKPKEFLLENVSSMKSENRKLMTKIVEQAVEEAMPGRECYHAEINSALVSVQSRKRLYWSSIPFEKPMQVNKLVVADILQDESEVESNLYARTEQDITPAVRYRESKWSDCTRPVKIYDIGSGRQGERIYSKYGKSVTITCGGGGPGGKTGLYFINGELYGEDNSHEDIVRGSRRLTPTEAERLQYVPDDYTRYGHDGREMSSSERYAMMGNGFTVTAIAWILNGMSRDGLRKDNSWKHKWQHMTAKVVHNE